MTTLQWTSLEALLRHMATYAAAHPTAVFSVQDIPGLWFGWVAIDTDFQEWTITEERAITQGIAVSVTTRRQQLRQLVEQARDRCLGCQQALTDCRCHTKGW